MNASEAGVAHPAQLIFNGGAAVFGLAHERGSDLVFGSTQGADARKPVGFGLGFEFRCWSEDLFGVDEAASRLERRINLQEELLLGAIR